MHRSMLKTRIRCLATVAALAIFSVVCASAQANEVVSAYARAHDLPTKHVSRVIGGRRIERIFVPVTPETHQSFIQRFNSPGNMILHARKSPSTKYPWNYYVRLKLADKVWSSHYDKDAQGRQARVATGEEALARMAPEIFSRYVVMNLGETAVEQAQAFLERYHKSQSFSNDIAAYKEAMGLLGRKPGDCSAQCMWWLPNLEISADGQNIMPALGVKRTRGPQEIPAIVLHAAKSELIPVVGVGVANLNTFEQLMTDDAKLLGPEPTNGGAAGAVR